MGIPISLAVLWLEVAQGIGLQARGVGFPGHFLVKVRLPFPHEGHVVIDPFDGESLSKEELRERLLPIHAESGLLRDASDLSDDMLGFYLQSATPREIVARMLRNLEEVYRAQSHDDALHAVQARLAVLLPTHAASEDDDRA